MPLDEAQTSPGLRKDKQANCGNNVPSHDMTALPPNHAAVSKDYSAYLIRASINGPGFLGLHRRKKPNLIKLSEIKPLRNHDPKADHGDEDKTKNCCRFAPF